MNVATAGDRKQHELSELDIKCRHLLAAACCAALKTHKNFSSVFFDICFYFFSTLSEFFAGIPSYLRYDTVSQLTELTS